MGISLLDMIAAIEVDDDAEQEQMSVPGRGSSDKPLTDKMVIILDKLQNNLLLVEPTLNWILQKEAELAQVQLAVLFTEEELARKREAIKNE